MNTGIIVWAVIVWIGTIYIFADHNDVASIPVGIVVNTLLYVLPVYAVVVLVKKHMDKQPKKDPYQLQ